MAVKTWEVIDGPLSVRQEPGGQWLSQLDKGMIVKGDDSTQRDSGGFLWLQHEAGWSAIRNSAGDKVYLQAKAESSPATSAPASAPAPAKPADTLSFKTNRQVRVRKAPSLAASDVRWLESGEIFETKTDSRTEADGYIWWQHKEGWSAEKSLDGRNVFMEQVANATASTASAPAPTSTTSAPAPAPATPAPTASTASASSAPAPAAPAPTAKTIKLQAAQDVRVRTEPDLSGAFIKWITGGTVVEFDSTSETNNDGYIWLKHKDGWSAWKNVAGSEVFLVEPGTVPAAATMTADGPDVTTLPGFKTLIERIPVDMGQTQWWQYFGNNVYAYKYGKSWGYDRYAQGLHSGLDFGNNGPGIATYAGLNGTFWKNDRYGVWLKSGDYTVIYQHLTNVPAFQPNQAVNKDTKIGELDPSSDRLRHLHFEIRYKGSWIINPLWFMSDVMVKQITDKFVPTNPIYFYKDGSWNQWLTPLDQPVIKLGGPMVGPLAR